MSADHVGLLAVGVVAVVLVGFMLLIWRLVVARRWRLVAMTTGFVVLVVFVGGFCGYRYGYYDALRGGVAQGRGDLDAAIRWFKQAYAKNPSAFMVAHDIACCYALKGDEEQCFSWLQKALESSYGDYAREHAKSEKDFESVRASKRFQELLAPENAR
jgi:tetratricopeptide (TPR) repeat protein